MPQMIPITPPTELRVTASIRNCVRISWPCAPTAMRTPISRVRSVTLTSMMFMMPMPPTSSETPAIAPSSTVITREVAVAASAISCCVRTVKSSSRPGRMLCRCRSNEMICCWAASTWRASPIWTLMLRKVVPPMTRFIALVYGITTISSALHLAGSGLSV